MYSQNDEEKWIVDFYKNNIGRFLDVGANDGRAFSCTLRLVELGWNGVCIDPSPSAFIKLQNLHYRNAKIITVNCAVDVDSKIKKFYERPNGYISTLSKEFKDSWTKLKDTYQLMYLKTITFDELFSYFGYSFDFIKIDVEGLDFEILQTLPFEKMTGLSMICIEYCRSSNLQNMLDLCQKHNFKQLHITPQNLLMVKG